MTAARKLQIVHYPETDHMGEDALQRFIAELLRPLIAAWLLALGRRLFVGADQFIYIVEGDPTQRIAPDIYVLPEVDPDSAPKCWKRWEIPEGPSFALEIVSTDYQKDYDDAPVDYARLGEYMVRTRNSTLVPLRERYHSTWLDNSKAKLLLGWRPRYDMARLVESAWAYLRAEDEPRRVWYPG